MPILFNYFNTTKTQTLLTMMFRPPIWGLRPDWLPVSDISMQQLVPDMALLVVALISIHRVAHADPYCHVQNWKSVMMKTSYRRSKHCHQQNVSGYVELLPTPLPQTLHGHLPAFCITFWTMDRNERTICIKRSCSAVYVCLQCFCLQCFDAVGWAAGRASGL